MNLTLISLLLCTNHNKPCQQLWKNVVSLWRLGTVMKDVSKVQNKRMQGTIQHKLSCQVTYQKKKKNKNLSCQIVSVQWPSICVGIRTQST